jgi:hypothetical protein
VRRYCASQITFFRKLLADDYTDHTYRTDKIECLFTPEFKKHLAGKDKELLEAMLGAFRRLVDMLRANGIRVVFAEAVRPISKGTAGTGR